GMVEGCQSNLLAEFPQSARELLDFSGGGNWRPRSRQMLLLERQDAPRRFLHAARKSWIARGLDDHRFVCTPDEIFLMADQCYIAARADVADCRLLDGSRGQHTAHLQIVGADEAAIADLLAQDVSDPFLRKRGRSAFSCDRWKRSMRDHYERQLASHDPVGREILLPQFLEGLVDAGQFVMSIEISLAQSGEMLAATEHACILQSAQKFAGVGDHLFRIRRDRP